MKAIKNKLVFIPLLVTVLLIIIGVAALIVGQPNEVKIYTSSDFFRFVERDAKNPEKKAVLYANIKLTDSFNATTLLCQFDGNGYTIDVKNNNIYCLFDTVSKTGSVKNLVLAGKLGGTDSQVTAGISMRNFGTIENCIVCSDFSGGGFVDGICHTNNGKIFNCYVKSREKGKKEFRYIWNPICAENDGSLKNCFYSDASTGKYDTAGIYIPAEEIEDKNLIKTLNDYCKNNSGLIGWKTDENGDPCLKTDDSREAASVFSSGISVSLVCIIVLIIAVPIFTIVYADKQKKKIFYTKV